MSSGGPGVAGRCDRPSPRPRAAAPAAKARAAIERSNAAGVASQERPRGKPRAADRVSDLAPASRHIVAARVKESPPLPRKTGRERGRNPAAPIGETQPITAGTIDLLATALAPYARPAPRGARRKSIVGNILSSSVQNGQARSYFFFRTAPIGPIGPAAPLSRAARWCRAARCQVRQVFGALPTK